MEGTVQRAGSMRPVLDVYFVWRFFDMCEREKMVTCGYDEGGHLQAISA